MDKLAKIGAILYFILGTLWAWNGHIINGLLAIIVGLLLDLPNQIKK